MTDNEAIDMGIKFIQELKDRTPLFFGKVKPLILNGDYDTICYIEAFLKEARRTNERAKI